MLNKMRQNKQGSAYYLLYGLFFLLAVGLIFVVLNDVMLNNIRPVIESTDLNFSQDSKDYADKYLGMWGLLPYVLVFVIMLFFILWIGVYRTDRGI